MKDFLKKYLTEEQLVDLEKKYLAEHPEEKGLPMHISKGRLDEVLGKKKTAEEAQSGGLKSFKRASGKLHQIFQAGFQKLRMIAAEADKQAAIKTLQQDSQQAARRFTQGLADAMLKAIRALIENGADAKKIEDEIGAYSENDSYLFRR